MTATTTIRNADRIEELYNILQDETIDDATSAEALSEMQALVAEDIHVEDEPVAHDYPKFVIEDCCAEFNCQNDPIVHIIHLGIQALETPPTPCAWSNCDAKATDLQHTSKGERNFCPQHNRAYWAWMHRSAAAAPQHAHQYEVQSPRGSTVSAVCTICQHTKTLETWIDSSDFNGSASHELRRSRATFVHDEYIDSTEEHELDHNLTELSNALEDDFNPDGIDPYGHPYNDDTWDFPHSQDLLNFHEFGFLKEDCRHYNALSEDTNTDAGFCRDCDELVYPDLNTKYLNRRINDDLGKDFRPTSHTEPKATTKTQHQPLISADPNTIPTDEDLEFLSADEILRLIELTLENPYQYDFNELKLHSLYTEKLTIEEALS